MCVDIVDACLCCCVSACCFILAGLFSVGLVGACLLCGYVLALWMCFEHGDVCWPCRCVLLSLLKCVGLVDVCWPWSCMLALEMHVGLVYVCGYS